MKQMAPWKKWLTILGLFIAILLPRAIDLDQYVTTDEVLWLHRSANFYYALGQREFEHTYQDIHPGVSIMWAGVAGFLVNFPEYRGLGQGYFSIAAEFDEFLDSEGKEPLGLLVAGKFFLSLGNAILLIATFLIAVKLVGELPAVVGFLMIAFDTYLIALNKILYPENFLPCVMFLASIAFMAFQKEKWKMNYLIIAAVAAGVAWITRFFGLFLIPYFGLLFLIELLENRNQVKENFRKTVLSFILWFFIAFAVFTLLWPAMWVAPSETLTSVLDAFRFGFNDGGASIPVEDQSISLSFNSLYYYLKGTLWRTTPLVITGLLFAFIGMATKSGILSNRRNRKITVLLFMFPFFFALALSLGHITVTRYVTTVFPFLDLIAAIGWVAVLSGFLDWLKGRFGHRATKGWQVILVGLLVASQILLVVQTHPYYWAYYNPLLGGAKRAVASVDVGYGEGLDQAARYLEAKPDASDLSILSWYGTGPFSYYFSGEVQDMLIRSSWGYSNAKRLAESDYVVTYVFQWQRGMTKELIDVLNRVEPEHTVILNGAEYAKVYKVSDIPQEDYENLIRVED
jgi:hypothetical protein